MSPVEPHVFTCKPLSALKIWYGKGIKGIEWIPRVINPSRSEFQTSRDPTAVINDEFLAATRQLEQYSSEKLIFIADIEES
ncbi:MAG: hypothetical protein WCH60_00410 [Burkholderiales bacterium]